MLSPSPGCYCYECEEYIMHCDGLKCETCEVEPLCETCAGEHEESCEEEY